MSKKGTAPHRAERCEAQKQEDDHHFYTSCNPAQPPRIGTALAAFLRRYRRDLLAAERTREVSGLLECVDALLLAADGPEVRP